MSYKISFSLILIIVGICLWLSNLNFMDFKRDWPLVLVLIGINLFIVAIIKKVKSKKKIKKEEE